MDRSLWVVLKVHNPWLQEPASQQGLFRKSLPVPFVPRAATMELRPGRAELVVGPRQAGKSTWIRQVLSEGTDPVLLLHAEEPRIRELCRSPAETLDALRELLTPETILLFEEVQHLSDAPLLIKGLVDLEPNRRIVITGSSSFQFKAKTRESLAGRARRVRLLPFSLRELGSTIPPNLLPAVRDEHLGRIWERLLNTGGYPGIWQSEHPEEEVFRLLESFVLKDASDLNDISNPAAFRKIMELAASNIGNLVNLSEWASVASISRTSAARYLEIASDAHVLQLVPPYAGGKRAEITGASKVFFFDNGLRNSLFGGFGPLNNRADLGALWENAVFGEIEKQTRLLDRVSFWRSKNGAEVDFVVERDGELIGIEVKASSFNRPVLSRSAQSFLAAYHPKHFWVVNASLRAEVTIEGLSVIFCRPQELGGLLSSV